MATNSMQSNSGSPANTPDRRAAPRHRAWVPGYVAQRSDGIEPLCVTRNVSRTGGFVLTYAKLQPGEPVTLELFLTQDSTQPTVARAHVRRAVRRTQVNTYWTFDVALQFDDPLDYAEPEVQSIAERQRDWWSGQ